MKTISLLMVMMMATGCVGRVVVEDDEELPLVPVKADEVDAVEPAPVDARGCCQDALAPAVFCDGKPAPAVDPAGLPFCP